MSALPYLNFARPTITESMAAMVKETLLSLQIASGPRVQEFEKALSAYHGGRPARVFTSATAAMEVAFQVCKIGAACGGAASDEVITSAMTFFSVGNMIEKVGAKTVMVDCDLISRNFNLDHVERAITSRTKAIVPTHFSGLPCDMDRLYTIAKKYNLFAERPLDATIKDINGEDISLAGRPDSIVASGFRSPQVPFFSFHEHKPEVDSSGDPVGQVLAAMMVGQAKNGNMEEPIFGCYVIGQNWYFLVLDNKNYTIATPFATTNKEIFDVVKMLKAMKVMIEERIG